MERIGVEDEIDRRAARVDNSIIYSPDGRIFPTDIMKSLSGAGKSYSIHRGDFHNILLNNLSDSVDLKLNHSFITAEDKGGKVSTTFNDGQVYTHDLLIGADGIRSKVRRIVSPEAELEPEGTSAIRALIPKSELTAGDGNFRAWLGNNKAFLTYPVKDSREINIAAYVPSTDSSNNSWSKSVSKQDLAGIFEGWAPEVMDMIENVETAFSWELYDHSPLSSWSSGSIALIGDAAHAMLPYLGQGANQAIEDCGVLASILEDTTGNNIRDALREFEAARKDTAATIQLLSRQASNVFRDDFSGDLDLKAKYIEDLLSKR
jgi:salicylate hydroxylase